MRVYCTNCGQPNDAMPGTKVMCVSCTAVFEVPTEASLPGAEAQRQQAPTEPVQAAKPVFEPFPAPGQAPQSPFPAPLRGPQPLQPVQGQAQWGVPQPMGSGLSGLPAPVAQTNSLAVASLVFGLLCCMPFNSLLAVGLGLGALSQLNEPQRLGQQGRGLAMAGVGLGAIQMAGVALLTLLSFLTK